MNAFTKAFRVAMFILLMAMSVRLGFLEVPSASAFLVLHPSSRRCTVTSYSYAYGGKYLMKRKLENGTRLLATAEESASKKPIVKTEEPVPLCLSEGLFAVEKPLEWTSQDVVSYIRGVLESDARGRGADPVKATSRKNKSRILKVGHGGTLDPLASGILVIGVGKGTKELQSYLSGPKRYTARGEFGFETNTLDMDVKGSITKTAPFDHVTLQSVKNSLPSFTGKIIQIPPIFSAIRKGGKQMYKEARKGKTAEDLKMEPRQVEVYGLQLITSDEVQLPSFDLDIECGGGTYVRSLIRDIGYKLDTVATMTFLKRTQQGQFTSEDTLEKDDWTPEKIYEAIDEANEARRNEARRCEEATKHEDNEVVITLDFESSIPGSNPGKRNFFRVYFLRFPSSMRHLPFFVFEPIQKGLHCLMPDKQQNAPRVVTRRTSSFAFWPILLLMRDLSFFSTAHRPVHRVVSLQSCRRGLVAPACSLQSRGCFENKASADPRTSHRDLWSPVRGESTQQISSKKFGVTSTATMHRAYIAVGSNLGDRFGNIASALELLCDQFWQVNSSDESAHIQVVQTSYLHETAPMYVTGQPRFLNGVVEVSTNLTPHSLLRRLKHVEKSLGRHDQGVRNGPRPVDLDIVLYESRNDWDVLTPTVVDTLDLVIPHPRMEDREFVLRPLCELITPNMMHPVLNVTINDLFDRLIRAQSDAEEAPAVRVLPLPRDRMLQFNQTIVMGILNVTPDSFSDGGKFKGSVQTATKIALQMEQEGAGIIDIGGESTRPGAKEVLIEEELRRTIPVIQDIRKVSDVPISIDTRHAEVARAAVKAGADIVNDVSGGTFDPQMLETVAQMRVPIILMHMRGTPETMQQMTEYGDVVSDVAAALLERSREAEQAGIPRWMQVLDPGIGFAKDLRGNLLLLKKMSTLRSLLRHSPILLGPSRKGFIGKIANETNPEGRDFGTVASCVAALCLGDSHGCSIIRVHNVKGMKQAAIVMDAIVEAK